MRLIDSDWLLDKLSGDDPANMEDYYYNAIKEAPTIEAEPVRRGEWIEVPYVYIGLKRYCCDQCSDDEYWKSRYLNTKEKYCPNCGAKMKMDGGDKE